MTRSFRIFICFIALLICGFTQAQETAITLHTTVKKADDLLNTDPSLALEVSNSVSEKIFASKNDTLEYYCRFIRGIANYKLGNKNEALDDFIKNRTIAVRIRNDKKLVESINAIANVYKDMDQSELALRSYAEALQVAEKFGIDAKRRCVIESNIAVVYYNMARYDSSNYYTYKALAGLSKLKSDDYYLISNNFGTLIANYISLNKPDSVEKYRDTVLSLKQLVGDKIGYAGHLFNLGDYYYKTGDFPRAEKTLLRALETPQDNIGLIAQIRSQLGSVFFAEKKFRESAQEFGRSLFLNDSLAKAQAVETLQELEVKYETGKKEAELRRLSVEKENDDLRLKQSKFLLIISIVGIVSCLVIAYLLFRQNRNRKKANQLLQVQNDEILHQKKEITDSISYARRIQKAILPPDHMVERLLPSSFILYIPKDVVSGDFYWLEEKNGLVMFAAVDCTGHGVPGAMMSVIGMNLLNQAVKEKGLTVPADILQHLDTGVTDTLRQYSGAESVKDGMDLSLCALNSKTMELQFAGAFNNLWLVRRNVEMPPARPVGSAGIYKDDLLEIKADKFPIGSNLDGVADVYTNHTLQLQKGDCIYLYSDGFADQFGGPKGKKFKYNSLKDFLISVHDLSPAQQREQLLQAFTKWKGNLEQVDDILVIGVKI